MSWFQRVGRFVIAFFVVATMVGGTYLGQMLQLKFGLASPYFITYFDTIWLLFLGIFSFARFGIRRRSYQKAQIYHPIAQDNSKVAINTGYYDMQVTDNIFSDYFHSIQSPEAKITFKNMFLSAILFALFWLMANYLYGLGLAYTNAASTLSLEQAATVFVFLLSIVVLKERVNALKIISIIGCISGAICIALADSRSESGSNGANPLLGDTFVLISTVATALYMVLYKKLLDNLSLSAVNLFLAMIGFWNLILFWPGIILLHYFGIEKFDFDSFTALNMGLLIVNAVSALTFNYMLNMGIFLTSPLFMRIAIMCSIPASFIINTVFLHTEFNWIRLGGATLIVIGFILFSMGDHMARKNDTKSAPQTNQI